MFTKSQTVVDQKSNRCWPTVKQMLTKSQTDFEPLRIIVCQEWFDFGQTDFLKTVVSL